MIRSFRGFLRSLGPGLITASVVVGPGSIVTASRAGAHFGYSLVWLTVLSSLFMTAYTLMAARVGCATEKSVLTLTADRFGRSFAVIVGLSCFFVVAGFQFGNNLGVATAMEGITGIRARWWPAVFTTLSFLMLFGFRNLYSGIERLMKLLVGFMVLSFVANLFYTGIDPVGFLKGFRPNLPEESLPVARGMFPTTFSVVAALYTAHLVQEKKWQGGDEKKAQRDAVIGIGSLCFISLTILCGAAGAFYGRGKTSLETAADLAVGLEGLFGSMARLIFCFGLAAASFSSFLVNALIGGGLLADGLGMERSVDRRPVRIFTLLALLIGMGVATMVLVAGTKPVSSILFAQASTLLAVPVCALLVLFLSNDERVMGKHKNGWILNTLGFLGFCVLMWMTWNTFQAIVSKISG